MDKRKNTMETVQIEASNAAKVISDAATAAALAVTNTASAAAMANIGVNKDIEFIKGNLSEIKETLKELSGYYATKTDVIEIGKIQVDHEARLRNMEQSIWKFIGTASAVSGLLAIFGSYLLKFIK